MGHSIDLDLGFGKSVSIFIDKICWIIQLSTNSVEIQCVGKSLLVPNITKDEIMERIARKTANG